MADIPHQKTLNIQDLRAAGIPEPWNFGVADSVRFGELDVLAHVNNTAYLSWFENFRINYFKEYGIADYQGEIPRIVLRQIGVDFLAEIGISERYIVTGRTSSLRSSSFRMEYGVWASNGLRATGWAVLVMLNSKGAKQPLSASVRKTLIERDNSEEH